MFLKRAILALQALLAASLLAGAAVAGPVVNSGHIESELVAQEAGIAPGGTVYVALRQKIIPGWHTYWRNPGDAGEATRIAWTLPVGWTAGDMVWPTPKKARLGPLLDYAYEGEVLIPVPITAPADAQVGTTISLNAAVSYLVCEQVCVPEDAKLTLLLPVVADAPAADPKWGAIVGEVLAKAPKPAGLQAVFKLDGQTLKLAVTGGPLKGADMAGAYFFPYSPKVIEHAADQTIERGPEGLTLTLKPGYDFVGGGTAPAELAGVLATKAGAWEVTATAGEPPATASGLGAPPAETAPATGMAGGLIGALAFAFVGGLILNLMPCVFPVLSMKAASLAGHAHDAGKTRLQGLVFLLGVVATFLALAGLLLAVRAGGAAVGWGFQLQSPLVIAGLALLMLLVALNMSGVFEIGTSVQNVGSGASAKGGATGAFFTGALAVVVAAPCTAPFMAGALGYALTQPTVVALSVFLALALGFAAPFVAVAFIPGLLKLLPRPGAWMDVLKKGLAFPMYGAALWLVWVFAQQAGPIALGQVLGAGVLAAFGAWLYGVAQARRASGKASAVSTIIGLLALFAAIALAASAALSAKPPTAGPSAETPAAGPGLAAEAWSPEKVKQLQAEGRPILVDFTAAWCVTCQVNEKVALSGAKVADAFKARNAVYLKADWTNRDPVIAKTLAEFGRVGVPLYVVYPKNGGAPVILPQLLTEGLVIEAIEKAGA
ncbi:MULTISPECIES: protein-disulfide reductase DsbD [unclassified Caulobacter]|uniref:protein-disulfide reductase DsbD family protein n=1 Tax=unclassified Caulobacter TaxID=2648921 RepID=UPI0006F8F191|nr:MULTISPECIES: thioredoxin family protein [unclassified Caulobacter]KQV62423.1 thiol:disulfide interchange protein [Caulobacter sp. Root342]KQV65567.1 thiol:disulfide interchange protein [Caulobacter sp. Root343]